MAEDTAIAKGYKQCQSCNKIKKEDIYFYTYKNGEKTELCKECLTRHIDNFKPETFLWILKKMDVPYIPEEWNVLRDRAFKKNPLLNGMSVFGKYLSKMKLNQWKDYGWDDTEMLQEKNKAKAAMNEEEKQKYEADLKEQLEKGEISEAEYKTLVSTPTQKQEILLNPEMYIPVADNPFSSPDEYIDESLIDTGADLTEDDKMYLAMKWGRTYKPNEWVELEKKFNDMMNSFDIQDADTMNTLILICKTDLQMNQALDCRDYENYQKLSKVSEGLRKTAKFTAAQNKENKDEYVDSIGELITMCERDGFIPRFITDIPQDKVDATLQDMNNYVKKLVTQDLGFGQQIEDALKKIQIQNEMRENENNNNTVLDDEDFEEYYQQMVAQKEQDEALLEEGEE